MPLINILFGSILLLVALLGIQLLIFEHQAERQAVRQTACIQNRSEANRFRSVQPTGRANMTSQNNLVGFMSVGKTDQPSEQEKISYWLPSSDFRQRSDASQKEAARSDCFYCA